MAGKLIVFEGIDGSGKSTQVDLLFQQIGSRVDKSKTFSSTGLGSRVEVILKDLKPTREVEALLFAAARLHTYKKVIKPNLNIGTNVICDRYLMDAFAYSCNSITRVLEGFVMNINSDYRKPDITFLLDIDPEVSLDRIQGTKDHYEKVDFLRSVREKYLELTEPDPDDWSDYFKGQNWVILDGSKPVNVIQSLVWEEVQKIL